MSKATKRQCDVEPSSISSSDSDWSTASSCSDSSSAGSSSSSSSSATNLEGSPSTCSRSTRLPLFSEALPFVVMAAMTVAAPHVKVEESFNAQAMHDLLFLGGTVANHPPKQQQHVVPPGSSIDVLPAAAGALSSYDHHVFPGVVPRTSLGALLVAGLAAPLVRGVDLVVKPATRVYALVLCRLLLGTAVCASLVAFARTVAQLLVATGHRGGKTVGAWFLLLAACTSFHLMYYASRPLPNTFALLLVTIAATQLLGGRPYRCIATLSVAAVVFRADVLVLCLPLGLALLFARFVSIAPACATALAACAVALVASITIDSLFWRTVTWPEGVVFYFNTVLNKSGEWGVMPWHWYLSSALPRGLLLSLPLALLGVLAPPSVGTPSAVRQLGLVAAVFVALYSKLPHKELRFILIVFPWLLLPAAAIAARLWQSGYRIVRVGLGVMLLVCAATSGFFFICNAYEYVGADALDAVQDDIIRRRQLASTEQNPRTTVFVDAYAAMNGITRFEKMVSGRSFGSISYSKDPEVLNRTRLRELSKDEASVEVANTLEMFDYVIVRHEDADWLVPGSGYAKTPSDFTVLATVPKRQVRFARSLTQLRTGRVVQFELVPFLTVLARRSPPTAVNRATERAATSE